MRNGRLVVRGLLKTLRRKAEFAKPVVRPDGDSVVSFTILHALNPISVLVTTRSSVVPELKFTSPKGFVQYDASEPPPEDKVVHLLMLVANKSGNLIVIGLALEAVGNQDGMHWRIGWVEITAETCIRHKGHK